MLLRLKNQFEPLFALPSAYTLFGRLSVAPDDIVFIAIGSVSGLFCLSLRYGFP